jgi:hypothetical protein
MNETINLNVFCFTASPWINEDAVAAMCGACARVDFYCRFLPAKLTSRFLPRGRIKCMLVVMWKPRGRKMRLVVSSCIIAVSREYRRLRATIRTHYHNAPLERALHKYHCSTIPLSPYEQQSIYPPINNPGQLCAVVQQ